MEKGKPSFREKGNLIILDDSKLIFNSQLVKASNFFDLRLANYGSETFNMSTMPELVELVYASLENQDHEIAKEIANTWRREWASGDTATYYFSEGMFVEDTPNLIKFIGVEKPSFKTLERKLGKHEEKGVVFSDDGRTRFTPYNYKTGLQSHLELSRNTAAIAFAGGEEKAEKLAKASEHYSKHLFFRVLDSESSIPRIADLGAVNFEGRFFVDACGLQNTDRYSFGVKETQ